MEDVLWHVAWHVCPESIQLLLYHFSFLVFSRVCGQALERQKEYFDCIRNERDELRDELADIKGKAKAGEVGLPKSHKKKNKLKGMSRWPKIESWPKTTFFAFWLEAS